MADLFLLYASVGAVALLLALVGRKIRELPLSEPLVALLLGLLLGPQVLDLVGIGTELRDVLLLEGSRVLLALSVMAAALRFPATALRPLLRPVLLLLAVVMPFTAAVSGAAAWLLGLPLGLALLLGTCLSPTDPVLASSVVSGAPAERDLPKRLRQLLTAESGANDGLALPLVGLMLAVVLPATGPVDAAGRMAWEVLGGSAIGVACGLLAGWGMRAAVRRRTIDHGAILVFTLLLALATLGTARAAHTDGVLAVFVAGLVYNQLVDQHERGQQDAIDEAVNRYAVLPLFVLLGLVLPWSGWADLGPTGVLFAVAVVLLRRLPLLLILARPLGLGSRDATFVGWFGPIGVSAIFYLAHSVDEGVSDPRLFAAGSLAVVCSILAFGVSAAPGRRLYARGS